MINCPRKRTLEAQDSDGDIEGDIDCGLVDEDDDGKMSDVLFQNQDDNNMNRDQDNCNNKNTNLTNDKIFLFLRKSKLSVNWLKSLRSKSKLEILQLIGEIMSKRKSCASSE
jgi:hypothetical protein